LWATGPPTERPCLSTEGTGDLLAT
jgi:hypothetical protein